jgi:nicotinamidase-related amidase
MPDALFRAEASLLLVIDVQDRLWPHIANRDQVRDRCAILMKGAQLIGVPMVVSEQYPKGLGPTIAALREAQPPAAPLCSKTAFGCLGDAGLAKTIEDSGRRELIVCGIETHVCVLQTTLEALSRGYRAGVAADAVGSRHEDNRLLAIARMREAGAVILSSEMILFEWMRDAAHPAFRAISALVK